MGKFIAGFVILYIIITMCHAIVDGGGGFNSTKLTSNLTATDTTINVSNTGGFLSADFVVIEGEKVSYTGKTGTTFTGCVRTNGKVHIKGKMVYSPETSVINETLQFNPSAISSNAGFFTVPIIFWKFFTVTIPATISTSIPGADGDWAVFGLMWSAFNACIGIGICIAFIWVFGSLIGRIF
jgi:hypothetical protein